MGNFYNGGESHSTAKNLLISSPKKVPLSKSISSVMRSVIPSPSNSNFHLITL